MSSFLTRVLFPQKSAPAPKSSLLARFGQAVDDWLDARDERQIAQIRHNNLHAMASKLADFYPTPDHIPNPHDPAKQRRDIAMIVGGDFDTDDAQYRQVMELYKAEYAAETSDVPVPNHDRDRARDEQTDRWDRLNEAIGGGMWTNPHKTAVVRRLDRKEWDNWEDFHAAVVKQVDEVDFDAPAPRTELHTDALHQERDKLGLTQDQRRELFKAVFNDSGQFFDEETFEFREGSVKAWMDQHYDSPEPVV